MQRMLGYGGVLALIAGVVLGVSGTGVGQQGQAGYDDDGAAVLGTEQTLPEGAEVFEIEITGEGGTFGESVPPGAFLDIVAPGFGPDTKATIDVASEVRTLAFVSADGAGVVRARVQVPEDLDEGDHTLQVNGVGPDGEPRTVSVGLEVGTDDGGIDIPLWTPGLIALALLAIAFAAWMQVRRREHVDAGAQP